MTINNDKAQIIYVMMMFAPMPDVYLGDIQMPKK